MELSGASQCTGNSPHCVLRYTVNTTMIENIYEKNSGKSVEIYEDVTTSYVNIKIGHLSIFQEGLFKTILCNTKLYKIF